MKRDILTTKQKAQIILAFLSNITYVRSDLAEVASEVLIDAHLWDEDRLVLKTSQEDLELSTGGSFPYSHFLVTLDGRVEFTDSQTKIQTNMNPDRVAVMFDLIYAS